MTRFLSVLAPPVSHGMDGGNLFRVSAQVRQLFSQLDNELIQSAGSSVILIAPHLIENAIPREHLVRMSNKKLKKLYLAGGERSRFLAPPKLKSFGIKRAIPKLHTTHIGNLRRSVAAQERVYPCGQFTQAKRLGHV